MSISILLLLSLIVLILFKKRTKLLIAIVLNIAFIVGIGCGYLPVILMHDLQISTYQKQPVFMKKNAIVVLGSGLTKWQESDLLTTSPLANARIFQALRLYHSCKQAQQECQILISGGDPQKLGMSEAATMEREFVEAGVHAADLIIENKSLNTFENARFSSDKIKSNAFDKVFIVTSGYHLKRALTYFEFFGVKAEPAPSDHFTSSISLLPSSQNFLLTDLAVHEYLGMARFHVYNLLGLNK